ncbi:MAG: FumA C-terminus/TtdB family hydratase beta subunit [Bacteroides sp.]|nr:FumA C-terminus/TtdB family hydratase beta subunit [Prevotella sp.]MCM1407778.1 FumA C-terminus/TtdB family hydratase beta subunit [Treponema brennaborense]MCM1468874.1 FumA C-terminus/TtdB family hydratase beta subunit [Bacteroides sp.]
MIKKDYDFFPFEKPAETLTAANGRTLLLLKKEIIADTIAKTFERLSFTFTKAHTEHIISSALAENASANDRYVCACLLKNAAVSARGVLPLCQDTGIATIFGWKGADIVTDGSDYEAASEAVANVYKTKNLRFSTVKAKSFFEEYNPQNNLPAQIMLFSGNSGMPQAAGEYRFLCCAKGGGSSNKTVFIQATKAVLTQERFEKLLREKIAALGTSACPPYTIAVAAGGLSPEQNLLALKLATCGETERCLPESSFRDAAWEARVLQIASETGFGAQFGGTQFAVDAVVLRLPRHGASCPVSIGVSCSAHRNLESYITKDGIYIEKTAAHPEELPRFREACAYASLNKSETEIHLDTGSGIQSCLDILSKHAVGTRLLLSGPLLVARDAAHAKWKQLADSGQPLPAYTKQYPVCYAGPAETPDGYAAGSFGPTTAGRMDDYADMLMSRGASLISLAKGNRSASFIHACAKYGGFYLGTPGGIAALIAEQYIRKSTVLDYPELGMEAVRLIEVENLPVFIITDKNGNDFYTRITADAS